MVRSEALKWDARKRNVILSKTINYYEYFYFIDDESIVHVIKKRKAINIHEWRSNYDNSNGTRLNAIVKELGDRQRASRSNSYLDGNRRKSRRIDSMDLREVQRKGDSDGAGRVQDGIDNRRSIEVLNREYLKAVENNDLDTAQMLVIEAVRYNGYNYDGYHGTDSKTFTVFKPNVAIYLATSQKVAEDYAISGVKNNKGVYRLTTKMDEPYVVDNGVYGQYPDYTNIPTPKEMALDGYPETVSTEEIAYWAKQNGYDGVVIRGLTESYDRSTDEIIVFSPNQVKSLDTVTYDEQGNVIPLSERFNEQKEDILHQKRISTPDPSTILKDVIRNKVGEEYV